MPVSAEDSDNMHFNATLLLMFKAHFDHEDVRDTTVVSLAACLFRVGCITTVAFSIPVVRLVTQPFTLPIVVFIALENFSGTPLQCCKPVQKTPTNNLHY